MFDGVFRSLLSMLNIEPEEAGQMARKVVDTIDSVDVRLSRIEAALNINPEEGAEDGATNNVVPIEGSTPSGS